jgi:hypothetical protein
MAKRSCELNLEWQQKSLFQLIFLKKIKILHLRNGMNLKKDAPSVIR